MNKKIIIFMFLLLATINLKNAVVFGLDGCINITFSGNSTYTITQNDSYYCLNQSWYVGVTAIAFANGVHNTTLDCFGYNVDSNSTSGTYGIYLEGAETKNNTIKNCNITNFFYAFYLAGAPNNTFINNTAKNNNCGFRFSASNNTFINNTAIDNTNYGFYAYSGSEANTFINNTARKNLRGFYIYDNSVKNLFINNFVTENSDQGIHISANSNDNILINNSVFNNSVGLRISLSYDNQISGGSIHDNSLDVYLFSSGTNNYFTDINFTNARAIQFDDTTSWFIYKNATDLNVWLKTNVSSAATITRKLISWEQSLMEWNDSSSLPVIARYNISGLKPNTRYTIFNDSAPVYYLQTDLQGNLPSFTIYLASEHRIKVSEILNITINLESTKMSSSGKIVSRPNDEITVQGFVVYSNSTPASNSIISFYLDSKLFGSNHTNSVGNFVFSFSIPYEGTYNFTAKVRDEQNNTGESSTVLLISQKPIKVEYNLAFHLGQSKETNSFVLYENSYADNRTIATNTSKKYLCSSYNNQILSLIFPLGYSSKFLYEYSSLDYLFSYSNNLESSLLLAFTHGTCNLIENKYYLVEKQTIPSRPLSSFAFPIPEKTPVSIVYKNERIQIIGTDRFSTDQKLCVKNLGISEAGKRKVGVELC